MSNRQLAFRVIVVATVIPLLVLTLVLAVPSRAIDPSSAALSINSSTCLGAVITLTRDPTTNDGFDSGIGANADYYRITIIDGFGNTVLVSSRRAHFGTGIATSQSTATFTVPALGFALHAFMYDQTTFNASDPNGILLASAGPFPINCGGPTPTIVPTTQPGATPTGSSNYYPPTTRVMALIRVDTPVLDAPSNDANVKAMLKAGQTWFVTTPDPSSQFYQIFVSGPNLGWVRASDIQLLGSLPGSPNAGNPTPNPLVAPTPAGNPLNSPIQLNNPPFYHAVVSSDPNNPLSVAASGSLNSSIRPADSSALAPIAGASLPGVVTGYTLTLRSAPGTNSAQVGLAHQGETYTVLGQSASGNWLRVAGLAGTGWVDGSFIRVLGSRASLPVTR